MKGKDKCKILKELRAEVAANNGIEWAVSECKHQGECKGTCPKCEAEVRKLEAELEKRRNMGKVVAVAGLSLATLATTTGCSFVNPIEQIIDSTNHGYGQLDGDVIYEPLEGEDEPTEGMAEPYYDEDDKIQDWISDDGCIKEDDTENVDDSEIILDGDVEYMVDTEDLLGEAEPDYED